jgi:sulfocyanin
MSRRILNTLAILSALMVGRGASAQSAAQPHAGHFPIDSTWLNYDSASHTVKFELIAGLTGGAKSPFNFNGYTDGELTLTVPVGVNVIMAFSNQDGTPHSAMIIAAGGPIPNMAGEPAIPRAYTRQVSQGLAQGQTDTMQFKADTAGDYLIFCGVPGHGLSGMWIRFTVSPTASVATLQATPKG